MNKTNTVASFAALFFGGFANAADLPTKIPAEATPIVAAVYDWTGCYLGLQGGATFFDTHGVYRDNGPIGTEINHFRKTAGLVGGAVGCNYQSNSWVYGVEGDWALTNPKGRGPESGATTYTFSVKENWFSTVRGRAGFTNNNWLLYATGGVAFANLQVSDAAAAGTTVTQKETHVGWTAGLGAEVQLDQRWSIKFEGLYIHLSRENYFSPSNPIAQATFEVEAKQLISRVGLNYRF